MPGTFSTADMDAIRQEHEEWCLANDVDPNSTIGIGKAMQMLADYSGSASRQSPKASNAQRTKVRA
ncbi:hypothetical protein BC374_09560 [Ensifer sp. LC13]|nr:hypothetical protein BBX50_09495 [Ensifer sp. LC11]OCO99361.1 hypothetical protein BC374_09560 [Ensifer sp. LC13]OCP12889.1 hypothetical protein BC362_05810 [Ensifer sp. LC14]OCP29600.1 hypothetical protein BC364_08115 [Ensifer sp. LC499]